jgi:hypothetical protein
MKKYPNCDHNEKLTSPHQKNNFQFVMINKKLVNPKILLKGNIKEINGNFGNGIKQNYR